MHHIIQLQRPLWKRSDYQTQCFYVGYCFCFKVVNFTFILGDYVFSDIIIALGFWKLLIILSHLIGVNGVEYRF